MSQISNVMCHDVSKCGMLWYVCSRGNQQRKFTCEVVRGVKMVGEKRVAA